MKNHHLGLLALILGFLLIRPLEAATTALAYTGLDGITHTVSSANGYSPTSTNFGTPAAVSFSFDSHLPITGGYASLALYGGSFSTALAVGTYTINGPFLVPAGSNGDFNFGTASTAVSGYFTVLDITFSGSQVTSAAIDVDITTNNNPSGEKFVSLRWNSDVAFTTPPAPFTVPEPASFLLISLGGFVAFRRKRK